MIDRVAIIWANGSASIGWPLTDVLYKLENVAGLTAVFGPSHDELHKFTALQDRPGSKWYRVLSSTENGVASYTTEWETVLSDLLHAVDIKFGNETPDRSGFHKEEE